MITEVQITEAGVETYYAPHCPSGMSVEQFLTNLIEEVLLKPSNCRVVRPGGTTLVIDRIDVTSVTITSDEN